MSSIAGVSSSPAPARPALRPLALPTEHGGWGFLFEPLVLALAVAPSWSGALIAIAFVSGFLTRQPLKLALQDLLRGRSYPRTRWCWKFAAAYSGTAALALTLAIVISGWAIAIPLAIVAPLAIVQLVFDARNRSRSLLPELGGAIAMSSSAAAIAIAAGLPLAVVIALPAVIVARGIPTILYVRTLLMRSHKKEASAFLPLALHALALGVSWFLFPALVTAMFAVLFVRAAWGLTHAIPPAKKIGWTEIAWGTTTVVIAAIGFAL